jgi:uroporphyrinogen decarboxylase
LHVAGPTESILPYYPQIGVELANIDYYVSPQAAMQQLPHTCVDGNIKTVDFVEGQPAEIQIQANQLIEAFSKRGGFILSSGCEIPPESKPENITAMVQAAHSGR